MFKTPQTDVMMAGAIVEHMAKTGVKTIGYVGFNDALGEAFFVEVDKAAKAKNLPLVANERFAPKDTSVVGQTLKLIAAKPDAVIIGASGTPAALPARTLVEQGYKGKMYFNHGVAQQRLPARRRQGHRGRVRAGLPGHRRGAAARQSSVEEAGAGLRRSSTKRRTAPGSVAAFGSYAWDACLELQAAIPVALKTAQPGTKEFRRALREAIEGIKELSVTNGAVNMSKTDHLGLDARARVMVQVKDGKWVLQN